MRRPTRSTVFVVSGVVLAVGLLLASWIRLPYYSVGPGPAREVTPLISFDGRARHEPSGTLVMTTVRIVQLTPLTALKAWLDQDVTVASQRLIYPPGTDVSQEKRLSFSQMDESKIDAAVVVLSELARYPRRHGAGALILSTEPGCPADGQLFPGDVVTSIDGEPIDSKAEASRIIERTPAGVDMRFGLDVDGSSEQAVFARAACGAGGGEGPLVGVRMIDTFPFAVRIASGDVGGPSAGLMWAIGLYELLTPGDLAPDEIVAGTGTISLDGSVGGIGGIEDKVLGAEHAGASLFLIPAANAEALKGVDTGDMRVVPVSSFDDAVQVLREASAQG